MDYSKSKSELNLKLVSKVALSKWSGMRFQSLYEMRCAVWYHLYNLKNVKNIHGGVLLKVTLLHGCFSRFLNCTNRTKPWSAPYIIRKPFNIGESKACHLVLISTLLRPLSSKLYHGVPCFSFIVELFQVKVLWVFFPNCSRKNVTGLDNLLKAQAFWKSQSLFSLSLLKH